MRLFLALVPSAAVRLHLRMVMGGLAGARWQSDEQLHLTLRFVGETDRHGAAALIDAIEHEDFNAPTVQFGALGYFAKKGSVNALWVGVTPRDPLLHLHQRLDRICVRLGLEPDDRRFVPHVTLARFSRRSAPQEGDLLRYLADTPPPVSAPFVLDRLFLFESTLGQSGPVYTVLTQVPLRQD